MLTWRRIVNFGFGHRTQQSATRVDQQHNGRKTLPVAQPAVTAKQPSEPTDESEKQARQRWYHRLEQRQKVIDAESRLEQYRLTGNELYRLH
ncbi:MAG: hypothetical protein IT324_20995 [Anaerolineae bacterium]|nr:hypothetical protein [Anaerolineae bacterium]